MKPSLCLPAIVKPYVLAPQAAEMLAAAAEEVCTRCNGTGISGWKNKGRKPDVCRCARDSWRGEAEYVQAKIKAHIAEAARGTLLAEETTPATEAPAAPATGSL